MTLRHLVLDRVHGSCLHRGVERGHDAHTKPVQIALTELGVLTAGEFIDRQLKEVAVGAAESVRAAVFDHGGEDLGGALICGDDAVGRHEVKGASPAVLRLVGRLGRVPRARRRNDAGDHRRLGDCQVHSTLAEVGLSCGFDPVRAAAEVDRVEVGAKDLVLVHLLLDLDRKDRFLELPRVARGLAQVVVLDVLLRQR